MIITRKIQVIVDEDDAELRKGYYNKLYQWRRDLRTAANVIISHKFVQQNIRDFTYVNEDYCNRFVTGEDGQVKNNAKGQPVVKPFYVKDILKDEPGNSEQNVTYRVVSRMLKGKVPSEFFASLNQAVCKTYKERLPGILKGDMSVPSYRNIPIPFPGKVLGSLTAVERTYTKDGKECRYKSFTLDFYHIPLELVLGKDRSNNRVILERALEGKYKFAASSLKIEDGHRSTGEKKIRMYLCVCVDIPEKELPEDKPQPLYARLGFETPIMCSMKADFQDEDKGVLKIGNKEEFLYQRLRIQQTLSNLQAATKYTKGGRGRRKKTEAIERFRLKESNYVDTKINIYSCELVKLARKRNCNEIVLIDAKIPEEQEAKFLLRNWSYAGLKGKIEYKAKKEGLAVKVI